VVQFIKQAVGKEEELIRIEKSTPKLALFVSPVSLVLHCKEAFA